MSESIGREEYDTAGINNFFRKIEICYKGGQRQWLEGNLKYGRNLLSLFTDRTNPEGKFNDIGEKGYKILN